MLRNGTDFYTTAERWFLPAHAAIIRHFCNGLEADLRQRSVRVQRQPRSAGKDGPEGSFIASAANDRVTALRAVLILSENPFSPLDLFEDQFGHNDFPIGAFQQVMKALIGILFTPMYDGRYLAGDKFRANRWRECF